MGDITRKAVESLENRIRMLRQSERFGDAAFMRNLCKLVESSEVHTLPFGGKLPEADFTRLLGADLVLPSQCVSLEYEAFHRDLVNHNMSFEITKRVIFAMEVSAYNDSLTWLPHPIMADVIGTLSRGTEGFEDAILVCPIFMTDKNDVPRFDIFPGVWIMPRRYVSEAQYQAILREHEKEPRESSDTGGLDAVLHGNVVWTLRETKALALKEQSEYGKKLLEQVSKRQIARCSVPLLDFIEVSTRRQ